jgi:pimeloyl-ACP methyl ester carboxylesterase
MVLRRIAPIVSCLFLVAVPALHAGSGSFDSNGVKIHYTDQGRGEPVLLIHGFSVNDQIQWTLPGITRSLTGEYRVLTMDCRGHGKSGRPHDPKMYGTEMVEDVVRLLDHLQIKKAHVVGYSMGGFITLKLAAMHPERLLSATTGGAGWSAKVEVQLLDDLADALDQGKGIRLLIERLTPKGRPKPSDAHINNINQMVASLNDPRALAAVMRALKNLAITEEQLKADKVPTLAIVGELDPLRDGVEELKGRLSDLQIVVIEGADHMDAFLRPEFTKSLKAFLTKHSENGNGTKLNGAPASGK